MPSPIDYRKMLGSKTGGQFRKNTSDALMNATWWEDIQSRVIYLYDYWHDNNKMRLSNMQLDDEKIPIDAKFVAYSSQTYDKDQVTFHLQLRPGQECNVDYYDEYFIKAYDAIFPIGLYCDIPDEQGILNRWLVVDKANYNVTQFPTFEILRCDKVFEWIFDGKKYRCPGVLRSQNSYNSGIWADNSVIFTEDQYKFCVPLNRDTENIYQNQRIIIDNRVYSEPRTWQISKINRLAPNGIARLTIAQDQFDPKRDYIEHLNPEDPSSPIIGQWAGYYDELFEPEEPDNPIENIGEIKYTGDPKLIIGKTKKFRIKFEDDIFRSGTWGCFYWDETNKKWISFTHAELKTTTAKPDEVGIILNFNLDLEDPNPQDDYLNYVGQNAKITYTTNDGMKTSLEVTIDIKK